MSKIDAPMAEVEASVVGAMIARPKSISEILGTGITTDHFALGYCRLLFDSVIDAFFDDRPLDPISVARYGGLKLQTALGADTGDDVVRRLRALSERSATAPAVAHSKAVMSDYDRRSLIQLLAVTNERLAEDVPPQEIAAELATEYAKIATAQLLTNDILAYGDLGRRFIQRQRELMAAHAAGIEIGVHFGMRFVDSRLHGLKGSEMWILAGDPGSGKSAIAWRCGTAFAERQMTKPEDQRIGTLVISAEMAEDPSSDRIGQNLGDVQGWKLRDGSMMDDELGRIVKEWGKRRDLPLYFNFTSMMKASQMRALISEAVRRYGIGLVIIDHMRYFDADTRFRNAAEEDEEKARFVRERIAKDLDVAVILLAHTIKISEDRRPRLNDLRGGGLVAGHADFVSFVYQPSKHPDVDTDSAEDEVELLWEKNRHGETAKTLLRADFATMDITDPR